MKTLIEKIVMEILGQYKMQVCTVSSVDQVEHTCNAMPTNGDAEIPNVKLRTIINDQELGLILYPKVDTYILVGFRSPIDAYMLQCSQIDRLVISMQGFRLEVDTDGNTVFNDGQNDGLVKLPELKTQIEKNSLFLETIRDVFQNYVVAPGDGSAALKAAMSAALAPMQTADLSNAGNDKIKH